MLSDDVTINPRVSEWSEDTRSDCSGDRVLSLLTFSFIPRGSRSLNISSLSGRETDKSVMLFITPGLFIAWSSSET